MLKQDFINKLKQKHPNNFKKYNYSLIPNEFKSIDKIKIICNTHGVFEQRTSNHLKNNGCSKCQFDSFKSNTKDFISKANIIHNNKYSYDKSIYVHNKQYITITCPIHGDFIQRPNNHLNGQGCLKCGIEITSNVKRSNTEDFIIRAKLIHGTKYKYDKVNYINNYTKIIITCKIHGDFLQRPSLHLQGYNCSKCRNEYISILRRSNKEEFVRKAKLIHNNKYDYSKIDYINSNTKVVISCPTHGDFYQKPSHHLEGVSCPGCNESKGEKHISSILDNLNIQYKREYRILGYNYRYDFYLSEYNIYIEYHGKQHYKSVKHFGGKKSFIKQQRNDKTKIELIKRSNGLLIILDYKLNTLELIRDEIINVFNLLNPKFLENKEFTKDYIHNSKVYLYNNGIMYVRK